MSPTALPGGAVHVRPCRPRDRDLLRSLGHPPDIAAALAPSIAARIGWALAGMKACAFLGEDAATGAPVGSVQFVRARRQTGTWMFGHWRVAAARRHTGIGRQLIEGGLRRLPGIRRLYSFVDWGNEVSITAHRRLGFEEAAEIRGRALLGTLSTVGAAAPAARLRPAVEGASGELADLYARAMGPLWARLFPSRTDGFRAEKGAGIDGPVFSVLRAFRSGRARLFTVHTDGPAPGFVVWRGEREITLFIDPARCDGALLARVAVQVMALGAARDLVISLQGLRRELLTQPGPIEARVLMGLPDAGRLRPQD